MCDSNITFPSVHPFVRLSRYILLNHIAECDHSLIARRRFGPQTPVVYSTDRSRAVVPVLVLLFVALWFILGGDLFYVLPCGILFLCFFSPFSIAITLLGEERASLCAFRTFVRFALVLFCLFPLPLGVWEGLRFAIGLFAYLFFAT